MCNKDKLLKAYQNNSSWTGCDIRVVFGYDAFLSASRDWRWSAYWLNNTHVDNWTVTHESYLSPSWMIHLPFLKTIFIISWLQHLQWLECFRMYVVSTNFTDRNKAWELYLKVNQCSHYQFQIFLLCHFKLLGNMMCSLSIWVSA